MKNNNNNEQVQQIEILKAVAQAWLTHSGTSKTSTNNEYDAYRHNFPSAKPSRFKLEAAARSSLINNYKQDDVNSGRYWDFNQSLLDSYEIVTLSKRLERGLVLEDDQSASVRRNRRESSNSLRSLFGRLSSSKRFSDQVDVD